MCLLDDHNFHLDYIGDPPMRDVVSWGTGIIGTGILILYDCFLNDYGSLVATGVICLKLLTKSMSRGFYPTNIKIVVSE